MKTAELIEKWLDKCDLARLAQERYQEDPSPTNYTELKKAMCERRLMEERVEPRASHSPKISAFFSRPSL